MTNQKSLPSNQVLDYKKTSLFADLRVRRGTQTHWKGSPSADFYVSNEIGLQVKQAQQQTEISVSIGSESGFKVGELLGFDSATRTGFTWAQTQMKSEFKAFSQLSVQAEMGHVWDKGKMEGLNPASSLAIGHQYGVGSQTNYGGAVKYEWSAPASLIGKLKVAAIGGFLSASQAIGGYLGWLCGANFGLMDSGASLGGQFGACASTYGLQCLPTFKATKTKKLAFTRISPVSGTCKLKFSESVPLDLNMSFGCMHEAGDVMQSGTSQSEPLVSVVTVDHPKNPRDEYWIEIEK